MLSLSPFRRLVKDYFLICESYYQAIKTQPASKIEAIDMGRRGLHDEGSRLLQERLKGKIAVESPPQGACSPCSARSTGRGDALGAGAELPGAVLFACNHNAVRSPMAEAILKHLGHTHLCGVAGVRAGELDPFAAAVMEESASTYATCAESLDALNDRSFDLIVSLSPQAHHKALDLAQGFAVDVEYRPTPDTSLTDGSREQILVLIAICATRCSARSSSASSSRVDQACKHVLVPQILILAFRGCIKLTPSLSNEGCVTSDRPCHVGQVRRLRCRRTEGPVLSKPTRRPDNGPASRVPISPSRCRPALRVRA